MKREYRPIPALSTKDIERFWSYVDKRGPDECWEWQGTRSEDGYGLFYMGGRFRAPRVARAIASAADPGHLLVRHTCDNPPCCNPSHLLLGTNKDNAADAAERRLLCYGDNHKSAKLTEAKVAEMRKMYATGAYFIRELAKTFNVSDSTVRRIISGQLWRGVGEAVSPIPHRGERCAGVRATPEQVRQMRRLYAQGVSVAAISRSFGMSHAGTSKIVYRLTWKHVTDTEVA